MNDMGGATPVQIIVTLSCGLVPVVLALIGLAVRVGKLEERSMGHKEVIDEHTKKLDSLLVISNQISVLTQIVTDVRSRIDRMDGYQVHQRGRDL